MKKGENTPEAAPGFTRRQLLGARELRPLRDVLCAVLAEGQTYTKDQAKGLAEEFLKGKVN